jgi:hypothetical protein
MPDRRRVLSSLLAAPMALGLPGRARGQPAAAPPEISADDARRDLRILQRAFTALHPGLYRYATAEQIDAAFAAAGGQVAAGSSRAQLYLLASRLAAGVHCGHTWTNPYNQRDDLNRALFQRADQLPLTLRWVEGRVLVTGSTAVGMAAGAELLAIDGRPMAAIRDALLPNLRADGLHVGALLKRVGQLDSGPNGGAMDRLFPLLFPPADSGASSRYTLSLRGAGSTNVRTLVVDATSAEARDRALPAASTAWALRTEGDTAVLTLPTFAFWRSDFKPEAFLADSFAAIRSLPYLVIDIRDNEGGDDAVGRQVLAQLLREPLDLPGHRVESAYERVPYELARFLDTWDFGFFDRTGTARKGPGRNWLLPDQPGMHVEPVAQPYPGRSIVLVGPQNSSAGFLFARDLQRGRAATLLGQPTGGNLRGLNGGQLCWVNLPASGVGVDIPLVSAFAAGDPPDAGVSPDVLVDPRWADAAAGVDTELQAARALIARWRAGAG